MDCDEDEQFLAEWIFDESESNVDVTQKPSVDKSRKEVTLTPPGVVRRVYGLGRAVAAVFKEFSLHYWTSGGTTLGAVRHGGLIPWDDDLDLCVPESEEPLLLGAVATALADRHSIVICPANTFGYRIFHSWNSDQMPNDENRLLNYRYPFCDVFIMSTECKRKKKSYCLKYRIGRVLWPQETYAADDVSRESLTDVVFADFFFPCPRNHDKYLNATYGSGWKNIGRSQSYNHVTREHENCVMEFEVTDNCEPAHPFH